MERFKNKIIFVIIIELFFNVYIINVESVGNTKITDRIKLETDLNHLAVDHRTGNVCGL